MLVLQVVNDSWAYMPRYCYCFTYPQLTFVKDHCKAHQYMRWHQGHSQGSCRLWPPKHVLYNILPTLQKDRTTVEWTWWRHRNSCHLATSVILRPPLPYGSVINAVAKSVCNPVIPPASMPCTTCCFVCFYRPAFCRVCVHTMDFMSAHKQIN